VGICPVIPGRTPRSHPLPQPHSKEKVMTNIVYIVGAIVIVVAVLSFFGLR
jgi:ABC-type dipeptide/oligopeptide/nickel transport system permease subunit